jgi:hypothetical protein
MRTSELAERAGLRVVTPGRNPSVSGDQVYAGDRISDLLNAAGECVLLVTNLASAQLMRMAELLDVPAICLVNEQTPDDNMLRTAQEHATAILVSPAGLFETCGRLHRCLTEEEQGP